MFDRVIYLKAIRRNRKEKQKFGNIVLMMGMFHMLMMYMYILSKTFLDAGIRDILIQSGRITEGSVDKALCHKMYNRDVKPYKMVYEAIVRKILEKIGLNYDGNVFDFDITSNIRRHIARWNFEHKV